MPSISEAQLYRKWSLVELCIVVLKVFVDKP